ncbi:hypothetical protein EJ110_NYTH22290 [Nymphaea thermarum]|nr:hypothetical protein EJ110_NYTH22290 [Nymphaea thermarum]
MREWQPFVSFFFISFMVFCCAAAEKKTYIVQTQQDLMPTSFSTARLWYESLLESVSGTRDRTTIIYTYTTVLQGFSASLTSSILAVLPEKVYHPDTTRTPHFLSASTVQAACCQGPTKGATSSLASHTAVEDYKKRKTDHI